jgi:DNA uptake protein ComE-like DNA-binding protein
VVAGLLSLAAASPRAQIPAVPAAKLDLNRATLAELEALPIPPGVARDIYEHRTYRGTFGSLYDLALIESVTPEILRTLAPLVATMPPPEKPDWIQRYEEGFRQIQNFLSQEGAREELADEYFDQLRDPTNVNRLDALALQGYQNVSPVDAAAIVRGRQSAGRIENDRQLRAVDGLSYWGFRNLRDFVVYDDPQERHEVHGDLQFVGFTTPYLLDERDILLEYIPTAGVPPEAEDFETTTGWGIRGLDTAKPAVLAKLRLRLGRAWKAGVLTFRDVGEENLDETLKGYASWENLRSGRRMRLDEVVLGNFRLSFGQGLVMDNSDYFLTRKTGYGYNVRPTSILGDLSRSHEFALRGVAARASAGPVQGIAFYSRARKDGLVNPDGTINKYVIMQPRFTEAELQGMGILSDPTPGSFGLKRDAFRETLYGGLLRTQIVPGTHVGISGWEARYDARWNPNVDTIVDRTDLLTGRDAELFAAYDSRQLGEFRRVFGAEFQTVYQNIAVQGEYGKLDTNPAGGLEGVFSAAPEAFIVNAYVQYSDLNLLALWRSYDLGYDNPYSRAFSEDSRYEQTLLEDPFRLENPLLSWLAETTPQPKAERGISLQARYRVTRNFTVAGLEFDQWERLADGQDLRRYTLRLEYAPIFPLRFRLRQRVSSRAESDALDVRGFEGWDTRLETRVRLSEWDEMGFLYSVAKTEFVPRPRLSGRVVPEANVRTPVGQAASPGQALQGYLTHNVNDRLAFTVSTEIYEGFLWNYEDNEFIVLDDVGFRNWFLVRSRLSDGLLFRFKLTHDRNLTRRNIDVRDFESPLGPPFEGRDTRSAQTAFRVQLDYAF